MVRSGLAVNSLSPNLHERMAGGLGKLFGLWVMSALPCIPILEFENSISDVLP